MMSLRQTDRQTVAYVVIDDVISHNTGNIKPYYQISRYKENSLTQPSIPLGQTNKVPACSAGVKAGHVHLCQVAGNPA